MLDELGRETLEYAQQVMRNQHLPIASNACTDADGGDIQTLGNKLSQTSRDRFKHQAETAGLLQFLGIL